MFSVGDIVWAKSSLAREIFWPSRILESDSKLEDNKKKKPTVAYVEFLGEGTGEAIKNASNVQPFNCDRKDFFLKKGRNLKDQSKRLKFEHAVKEAEKGFRGKQRRTPTKHSFLAKKEANSPQVQGRAPTTSILNKPEKKQNPLAKTKHSLPTISEESNEIPNNNASTSTEGNKIGNNREKIVLKRGRKRKNNELDCGKEIKQKFAKDKNENNVGLKEAENAISDDKREFTTVVSSRDRKRGRTQSNSLNEPSSSRTSHKTDPKVESDSSLSLQSNKTTTNRKRFCFKSKVTERLRKKLRDSSKDKPDCNSVCNKDCKIKQNDNLETISEECELKRDEMIERVGIGTSGKDNKMCKKETKRPRIALHEDGRENKASLSNDKSESKEQSSSCQNTAMDGSESLRSKSNDNCAMVKQSLDPVVNCLESSSSCRSAIGLGHSELDAIQASCDNSGLASDETAEIARCDENKFESCLEKGESADIQDEKGDEEGNERDDCSSDDDSLPEAFSSSPGTKTNFRPGDAVWVKYRKDPFWPAQIKREAYKKKTHVYIKFLPKSDGKGLKVPKKNVRMLTEDHETFQRFKNQEIDPSLVKEFNEGVEQAEEILVRRAFQKDDNILDDIEDQVSDSSDEDEPSSPSNDKQDKPVVEANKPGEKPEDGESGHDNSETEKLEVAGNGRISRKRKQVTKYSNILKEIHRCKQRLLDIYREKLSSSRHKTFKYGTVTQKNMLRHRTGFGPIQDDETCDEIIKLLQTWYAAETKNPSLTLDYIWDVWLPEAMIYYIRTVDNVSAEQAENIYLDQTSHVNRQDVEETRNLLKSKKIDQVTIDETVERAKRKLHHVLET